MKELLCFWIRAMQKPFNESSAAAQGKKHSLMVFRDETSLPSQFTEWSTLTNSFSGVLQEVRLRTETTTKPSSIISLYHVRGGSPPHKATATVAYPWGWSEITNLRRSLLAFSAPRERVLISNRMALQNLKITIVVFFYVHSCLWITYRYFYTHWNSCR